MKIKNACNRLLDTMIDLMLYLAGALLIFSWLSVCAEVICRYFLSRPIFWVVEVTEYILVQTTFLGAAWLLKREGHVSVDIVTSHLNPKTQALLNCLASILCTIICLILTWYGATATWAEYRDHIIVPKQLGMPKFYVILVIPLGTLMLFFQFLKRTGRAFSSWRSCPDESG